MRLACHIPELSYIPKKVPTQGFQRVFPAIYRNYPLLLRTCGTQILHAGSLLLTKLSTFAKKMRARWFSLALVVFLAHF